jgi:fatty-acyl-CoA synthase
MAARDTALILPTSGTEGYPKLCKISLGRLVLAGHAFGGLLLRVTASSVIYCPLPLTHATALMAGLFPALVHGCALHLAPAFSASRFFEDVAQAKGTHVLYVGEMLRFVAAKSAGAVACESPIERFVGNGLDGKTWGKIAGICPKARIVEFYGATELPALLVNLAARRGAMGRVPFRAWSRFRVAPLPVEPVGEGAPRAFAMPCAPGELGELLIAMPRRKGPLLGAFEGYLEPSHERRALASDVFVPGDRYYRTGDVVYYDENDFFYFVDRLGDVWRHRGHNVSTRWIAEQLRQGNGVADCLVTPVALDESAYRAGLAVVVPAKDFDVTILAETLGTLPNHARPTFVLLVSEVTMTRSFKVPKQPYRRDVFDPEKAEGKLYVWDDGLREY